jgi:hypothetical protein
MIDYKKKYEQKCQEFEHLYKEWERLYWENNRQGKLNNILKKQIYDLQKASDRRTKRREAK